MDLLGKVMLMNATQNRKMKTIRSNVICGIPSILGRPKDLEQETLTHKAIKGMIKLPVIEAFGRTFLFTYVITCSYSKVDLFG